PFLSLTTAAFAGMSGMTPPHAYHFVTAIFYSLGPVTLFFFAWRISRAPAASFAASIFYSLISPSAFLTTSVRNDVGLWHPRRLQAMVEYGEGAHITSMTLMALALLLLVIAFEKRRPLWWLLAGLALPTVVLSNWLGGATLA